jgi:hypothetical protein
VSAVVHNCRLFVLKEVTLASTKAVRVLTEKQVQLLKLLHVGALRFPQGVHERKAYEKAELLGYAASSLQLRQTTIQPDGKRLRNYERAYRLTDTGNIFLGRRD